MVLADREGIDGVSMRHLAAMLGVVPMALYKHVANKEDLLGGMVDVVIGEYDPPVQDPDWRASVRGRILSARRALLAHPWARSVIETRRTRTPAVLGYMDSLAGMFMGGGLSAELTHYGMHVLGHRIWGFSPEAFEDAETLRIPDDPKERQELVERVTATYPHIAAIAMDVAGGDVEALSGGCDADAEFVFALDLILEAIDRLHQAGWSMRSV